MYYSSIPTMIFRFYVILFLLSFYLLCSSHLLVSSPSTFLSHTPLRLSFSIRGFLFCLRLGPRPRFPNLFLLCFVPLDFLYSLLSHYISNMKINVFGIQDTKGFISSIIIQHRIHIYLRYSLKLMLPPLGDRDRYLLHLRG